MSVGLTVSVALVDFLVQNVRTTSVEFFSVSGRVPVSVALLVAATAGATVAGVFEFGCLALGGRKQEVRSNDDSFWGRFAVLVRWDRPWPSSAGTKSAPGADESRCWA